MRAWLNDALTGTSGVTSMGRVLLLATVGTHLGLVGADVVWRLTYITAIGKTPQPAYPAFSQQIAFYMVLVFVVWVAGARWAKAWKESGLTGVVNNVVGSFRANAVSTEPDPVEDDDPVPLERVVVE